MIKKQLFDTTDNCKSGDQTPPKKTRRNRKAIQIGKINIQIMSKCKFCGSSSFGTCYESPFKKHEHSGIGDKCVYCGSSSYGTCYESPTKKHKHEQGLGKCIYCGSSSYGTCYESPSGKHEH